MLQIDNLAEGPSLNSRAALGAASDGMHEISIVQSVLDLAIQTAQASSATQIHAVRLRIGTMTGVVPEALHFAFEALREGTIAAEARLEVESVAAVCWCEGCNLEFESTDWLHQCPRCGQLRSAVRRGQELELASLEVT